jgi:hypothetical protein
VAEGCFAYESPANGYAAELQVADDGFAILYPGLWERLAA